MFWNIPHAHGHNLQCNKIHTEATELQSQREKKKEESSEKKETMLSIKTSPSFQQLLLLLHNCSLLKVFFFIFTHRRHWVGSERLPAPQIAVCSALLYMDDGDFSRKNERVWCDKKKSRYYIDYSAYRLFVVWQQSVGKNKLVCFNTSLSCIQTYF